MSIAISPNGDQPTVTPGDDIVIEADGGRLTDVEVRDRAGDLVDGAFDADRSRWGYTEPLSIDGQYTVSVTGRDLEGRTVTSQSQFAVTEVPESKQLRASRISPLDGSTVGVAFPLVVGFDHPVTDREAVQQALSVTTEPAVEGAWYWVDNSYVHYRPKEFWPAGTEVDLNVDLEGVPAGGGMWGAEDREISFTIGREQVIKVDVDKKKLRVIRDGKRLKTFPVSTGKPGWETRNGIKVISELVEGKTFTNEAIDAPEEYTLYSDYAMRMTNSGEFIHDAPWNVGNIGSANTSHGCVGMLPRDMAWLFERTMIGDPVIVTGSPRKYTEIWNRYQDWNVPWEKWERGNA